MARTEDLTIDQNTDFTIKLNLLDSNDAALDLTTKYFAASFKKRYNDTDSTDFTVTVIDAAAGSIQLSLSSAITSTLDTSLRYVYDVLMYDNGDVNITKVLDGKIFVKPSATSVGE